MTPRQVLAEALAGRYTVGEEIGRGGAARGDGSLALAVNDPVNQTNIWLVWLTSRKAMPLLTCKDGERFPAAPLLS